MLSNYGLAEKIIICQAISAGQVLIEECGISVLFIRGGPIDLYTFGYVSHYSPRSLQAFTKPYLA